jgi:NAD-dependent deacetylase
MNIFVLTGAGISPESGLGSFRGKKGLRTRFDPMKLAPPETFTRDRDLVHVFYNMGRQNPPMEC